MKKFRKNVNIIQNTDVALAFRRANKAVSEVVGTFLLLSIAISLSTVLSIVVLNTAFAPVTTPMPSVSIIGTTNGSNVILEHRGGDELCSDTKIMLTIGSITKNFTAESPHLNDSNGNGLWNIGERFLYQSGEDLDYLQVEAIVVDVETQSIVMGGVIREGERGVDPFARTLEAENVQCTSATLWMKYDFMRHNGSHEYVRFRYKYDTQEEWVNTTWINQSANHSGFYNTSINVRPNRHYIFHAQLQYNISGQPDKLRNVSFNNKTFDTLDVAVGIWHFDDFDTPQIAQDSSGRGNDGTLEKNVVIGPEWILPPWGVNDTGALSFDGINDYVEVPHSESLSLTNEITVEAWVKPLENSEGLVGEISENDTSEFGVINFDCLEPDLIHVSGDIYAIACRSHYAGSSPNSGFLITVNITDDGNISADSTTCIIDTLEFEDARCRTPKIIHLNDVNDNIYVIAYEGPGDTGVLKTVWIADNGDISQSLLGNKTFTSSVCHEPNIILVNWSAPPSNAGVYVIAYRSYYDDCHYGNLTTVKIAGNGGIQGILQNFSFEGRIFNIEKEQAWEPDIICVNWSSSDNEGVFAIVYRNAASDGSLATVNITDTGTISMGKHQNFDDNDCWTPNIIHVDGSIYTIVFGHGADSEDLNKKGLLQTVSIADNGTINVAAGNRSEFENTTFSNFSNSDIILINWSAQKNKGIFAIAYRLSIGDETVGYLKTVEIADNGIITQEINDTLAFEQSEQSFTFEPSIVDVNRTKGVYAIVYNDITNDGILKTVEIADNGTITDEFIDFGELGVFNCYEPDFIHISGDIYAIAYRGFNDGGYLKTVEITDNGSINNSFVDSFEFEASYCFEPNITHVTGNVYVIVYKGYDEYGILKIVNITDEGNISDSVNDEIEIDTSYCSAPKIIPVNWSVPNNKGVYAIVYEGATGGILKTAEIYGNGSINHSFSDYIQYPKHRLEFDTDECHKPDIIRVNGSFYAIAYGSVASEVGILKTVEILNNGSINQSIINTSEFHQGYCDYPDIIHVNNSVYAIVYSASGYARLITVEIGSEGQIGGVIDPDNVLTVGSGCLDPDIIHINGDVYAIVSTGTYYYGQLATMRIGSNGEISNEIDNVEYLFYHYDLSIIHVNGNVFALSYRDFYYNGFLKTVEITLNGTTRLIVGKELFRISVYPYAYAIEANATKIFGSICNWDGSWNRQILTVNLTTGWNHIVLTYNQTGMRLYNNVTDNTSAAWIGEIAIGPKALKFGHFNCILDEVIIYNKVLTEQEIINNHQNPT